jgi:serine/threonine protein kinase
MRDILLDELRGVHATGDVVDGRSDLFSLGSLLYHAPTEKAPFRADTVFGVIHHVCEADPRPIHEFHPEIQNWLVAAIERLLAKPPADRFSSAEEAADESILLHCSFDYMKAHATKSVPLGGAFWDGGAQTFIHKGTNGRWREVLSVEESGKYEAAASANLPPDCARWLATGEATDLRITSG